MPYLNRRGVAPILNASPIVKRIGLTLVLIHFIRYLAPMHIDIALIERFSFISARYSLAGAWQFDLFAYVMAPLTYMFLHGGMTHLLINTAMLLAFGTPIERILGRISFFALYVASGFASAVFWGLLHQDSFAPLVGASGAISGMAGAIGFIGLFDGKNNAMPFKSSSAAIAFVLLWLVFNFAFGVIGLAFLGLEGKVAWEAHLGGFLTGFVLVGFFKARRKRGTGH